MTAAVSYVSSKDGLSRYLREIRKFPMLTADDELALARRWRDQLDQKAADKLVTSHLRLVAKIAIGYSGYGLPLSELISEGNVGLMQATKRFDPENGARLATYAMWWIHAAMKEHILHCSSLVKMGTTAAQKKLFFNFRRLKSQVHAFNDGDLDPAQVTTIARLLNVADYDVISMNGRMAGPDRSLNLSLYADTQDEWQDWLVDENATQEDALATREDLNRQRSLFANAWKVLNDRERHIVCVRHLTDEPVSLEDLALHYGISRERVRQVEMRAMQKLQKAARQQAIPMAA